MSRRNTGINLAGYEEIFNDSSIKNEMELMNIHCAKLYSFKNHPFKVADDDKMGELVQSIMQYGVLTPGIARPKEDGSYEVIAGHRRTRACEIAGVPEVPMIVRELTDDEATIIMVDSNIQREDLLPSEKAFAYKMKMAALKHQGKKGRSTAKEVGEKAGDNERTVQRFIRLTYLKKELLDAVDKKKIAVIAGSELSYLQKEEQMWVWDAIGETGKYPSGSAAVQLKEYSKKGLPIISLLIIVGSISTAVNLVAAGTARVCKRLDENYNPDAKPTKKVIITTIILCLLGFGVAQFGLLSLVTSL